MQPPARPSFLTAYGRTLLIAFALLLISLVGGIYSCYGQSAPSPVVVTGHLQGGSGLPAAGTYVHFQLTNCTGGIPRIFGYTGIAPSTADFTTDSTGLIAGTVWGNDQIGCGVVQQLTRWLVTFVVNNVPQGPAACYDILSTAGTFNLDTAIPVSPCVVTQPLLPNDAAFHNLTLTGLLNGYSANFQQTVTANQFSLLATPAQCPAGNFVTGLTQTFGTNCAPGASTGTSVPFAQVPSGTVDGTNAVFTLASLPAYLSVQKNGITERDNIDYTLSGTTITFTIPPLNGDDLFAKGVTGSVATGLASLSGNNAYNLISPNHVGADGLTEQNIELFNITAYGSGTDLGDFGGWSVVKGMSSGYNVVSRRGIIQPTSSFMTHHGVGDTINYHYLYSDGGSTASADESIKLWAVQGGETNSYYHGTVTSTVGTGDTAPVISQTGATTDGGILLDISKGTISGTATTTPAQFGTTYLRQFTSSTSLPLNTAWGTCNTNIVWNHLVQTPTPVTCTMTLGTIGAGTPAFTTGLVYVSGPNYPEHAVITNVSAPSGGTQTIIVALRNPNNAGAILFQGGLSSQFLSGDVDVAATGLTGATGFRSGYDVAGSIDGTHLIYGFRAFGHIDQAASPMEVNGNNFRPGVSGRSAFHLYPGAEIIANNSIAANPTLEPNNVAWAAGDTIEGPHPTAVNSAGYFALVQQFTPTNGSGSNGIHIEYVGQGISGNYIGELHENLNARSWYSENSTAPGPLLAPAAMYFKGTWSEGLQMDFLPSKGMMYVQNCDGTANTTLFRLPLSSVNYNCANGALGLPTITSGPVTSTGGASAFASGTTIGGLNPLFVTTGFSGTKTAGSCVFTISNGLITAVSGC